MIKNHYNCTHEDAEGSLDNMQSDYGMFIALIGTELQFPLEKNIAILLQCETAKFSKAVKELLFHREDIFDIPGTKNKVHPFAVALMNKYDVLPDPRVWKDYNKEMIDKAQDEYNNFIKQLDSEEKTMLDLEEITMRLQQYSSNLLETPDYSSASVEDTTDPVCQDITISGNTVDEMSYPH